MNEKKHGFTTREEWTHFFYNYEQTIYQLNEKRHDLMQENLSAKTWIKEYKKRSQNIRRIYLEKEQELEQHIRYFTREPSHWTRTIADSILSYLFRYISHTQDMECSYAVVNSLIPFYQDLKDEIALMKCYTIRAFCYIFLDPVHMDKEILKECRLAAKLYEKHFDALTPEEQSMGVSIYDLEINILMYNYKLNSFHSIIFERDLFSLIDAAIYARNRVLKTADKDYDFNKTLPYFEEQIALLALYLSPEDIAASQADLIYKFAEQNYKNTIYNIDASYCHTKNSELIYLMACWLIRKLDEKQLFLKLTQIVEELFLKYNNKTDSFLKDIYDLFENLFTVIERFLRKEGSLSSFQNFLTASYSCINMIPINAYSNYAIGNLVYYSICYSLRYLPDEKTVLSFLLHLTIFRQIQTTQHSFMVSLLSKTILAYLIEKMPDLLVGQLKTSTSSEVQKQKEKFLEYIHTAGLLHDIGKLLCTNVINMEYRKISDIEFTAIKFHPVTGSEILQQIPQLVQYQDIVLGHHKSFDGTYGYPEYFDNTASPQKIFIDLITICDTLDAATDRFGRNYANPKNFDMVFSELQSGSGKFYSNFLVEFIQENTELQNRLRCILENERETIYCEVWDLMKISVLFPKS